MSEPQTLRYDDDYQCFFDPKSFLKNYFKSLETDTESGWISTYYMTHYHKFWTSLEASNLTMLEFGGGPTIYSLISACPHVKEIVFAEFTEANRKEVEAWLKNDVSAFDWSPYIQHVVEKVEGKTPKEALNREEELRKKISSIIPCDIRKPQPLTMKEPTTFDVVSSTGCFEAAMESNDMFCEGVAKLTKHLKPGGHLLLAGYLNSTIYTVGKETFVDFPISESLVHRAFEEAGVEILHFASGKRPPGLKDAMGEDYEGLFFTWGVLKNNK